MESISPIPWHEFATKDDLKSLKEWAEAKFEAQSEAMKAQSVAMNGQFNYLKGEIAKLGGNLSTQIAEQSKDNAKQTRTIVFWMAMFAVAVCIALVAG